MKAVKLGDLLTGSTWWSLNKLFQFFFLLQIGKFHSSLRKTRLRQRVRVRVRRQNLLLPLDHSMLHYGEWSTFWQAYFQCNAMQCWNGKQGQSLAI